MTEFLIVGYHEDTGERYADYVTAPTADEAERVFLSGRNNRLCEDLVVVGVVGLDQGGRLAALDTATHIRWTEEDGD